MSDDVSFIRRLVRDSMEVQAQEAAGQADGEELSVMKPMQVFTRHDIHLSVQMHIAEMYVNEFHMDYLIVLFAKSRQKNLKVLSFIHHAKHMYDLSTS